MRCLFGDVITSSIVGIIPIAGERFAQDRIKRFLNAPSSFNRSAKLACTPTSCLFGLALFLAELRDIRGFDVPTAQVEFDHGDESFDRVVWLKHGQESIRVSHKTVVFHVNNPAKRPKRVSVDTNLVMRSSMDLGSSKKVGRVTRERSAPGRSWDMMCERTASDVQSALSPHSSTTVLYILLLQICSYRSYPGDNLCSPLP